MSRTEMKRRRSTTIAALVLTLAVSGGAMHAAAASAAGDPIASGKFRLAVSGAFKRQLARNGVVMEPRAFAIEDGQIDPISGTGTLSLKGQLRFKHGRRKVVYRKLTARLDAQGYLKGNGVKLFRLRGGRAVRNGFGTEVKGVKASFLASAARKINRKLGLHSLRRASAGRVSVSEQPATVEVTGGTLHSVPVSDTAQPGSLASKLFPHCINGLFGISAIAPAAKNPPITAPTFDFPVTGGTIAPDATDGAVESGGGILVANNNSNMGGTSQDDACDDVPMPPLATLQQSDATYNFLHNYSSSHVVISGSVPTAGDRGVGIGSNLNLSGATISADPSAHTVTIRGIVVTFNAGSALFLNQTFRQPAGTYSDALEFAAGDRFGTVDLTVTTR
jgi:hypothetical protein